MYGGYNRRNIPLIITFKLKIRISPKRRNDLNSESPTQEANTDPLSVFSGQCDLLVASEEKTPLGGRNSCFWRASDVISFAFILPRSKFLPLLIHHAYNMVRAQPMVPKLASFKVQHYRFLDKLASSHGKLISSVLKL